MIYNTTITAVNESDILSLLEEAEDRFEDYTIAEATSMIVAEQEENWTRFMKGIGLSELSTVMEGNEVIYEGARLQGFIEKAKQFFQAALNKLAEITKSFIARFDGIIKSNDAFLKKYRKTLTDMTIPPDFEFKGYKFKNLDSTPKYEPPEKKNITAENAVTIFNTDLYTKEAAEKKLVGESEGDTFTEKLTNYFYGKKEKEKLSINITDQLKIIEKTKENKNAAKKSYTDAAKPIKDLINELKKAQRDALKNPGEKSEDNSNIDKAYETLISYWKAYAAGASQFHGAYMAALGKRNAQAKAICTKLLTSTNKAKVKADREQIKANTEGFIDTGDFLGAVEFI